MNKYEKESREKACAYLRIKAENFGFASNMNFTRYNFNSGYSYQTYTMQFGNYVRACERPRLAQELKSDPLFQNFASYILNYAKGQERNAINTMVNEVLDPEVDVQNILVGTLLDAMGYSEVGNSLLGLAVAGTVFWILLSCFKDNR